MATLPTDLAAELRARVHGVALTAATHTPPKAPKVKGTEYTDERLAKSSVGKGWSEGKVKRDTDPGEEGQFDFKDSSGSKGKGKGKGGGGKGKDPKKAAEAAAKKAQAELDRKGRAAGAAERKRASERRSADARAKRVKVRKAGDIEADINDAIDEMRAEESARGLKPGADYPGKMERQKKVALLRLELLDAELGDDAPIAERIALREKHLEEMRNSGEDGATPPEILEALEIDLAAFKAQQGSVEGTQSERKAKKAETERRKAEAEQRKIAAERKRTAPGAQLNATQRRQGMAAHGLQALQAAGKTWSADARKEAATRGHALSDGSYPIVSKSDWHKAKQALGRATNRTAVVKHLCKRGKALGIPQEDMDGL